MRALAAAAFAAVTLVGAGAPTPAQAAFHGTGVLCGMALSWASVTGTAEVYAGPLVLVDEGQAANPVSGSVTCTLQAGARHSDPDIGSVTSGAMTGVVVVPPTTVPVAQDPDYVCTRIDLVGGGAWYYDAAAGAWSASADTQCYDLGSQGGCDSYGCGDCGPDFDCVVCPVLAEAFPPEGDVVLPQPVGAVWDCPPYGNV